MKINIFWFRRDLRLEDNTALNKALNSEFPILPIFIFDSEILAELPQNDARVSFIYEKLQSINERLKQRGSSLKIFFGKPIDVWKTIIIDYKISSVFFNKDYEPYAIQRDIEVEELLNNHRIEVQKFKDHVIFEEKEILKANNLPYIVYTPYKNKWLEKFYKIELMVNNDVNFNKFLKMQYKFPDLHEFGFKKSEIEVKSINLNKLSIYPQVRDFPAINGTTNLSPHLRFGTISIRQIISQLGKNDSIFLSELIWREFFIQILFNYPRVVDSNFKSKYDNIHWRNNEEEFEIWKNGETGFPIVDAGIRELNQTGYMHNRVRMIVASFLVKHLLIDWKWGEAYFAQKLLDYELASNNGNWQWVAGTGCDAAPYFRIFNPIEQLKKFDPKYEYVKRWIPEFGTLEYPQPIVEHKFARERALKVYKQGLKFSL